MATVSSLSSSSDLLAHIQSGGTANRSFGIAFSSPPPISPPASFAVSPSACHDLLPRFSLHPLEQAWCLWFFKGDRNAEWEENLRYITSFDNVEGFWSLFNHLETPSNLPSNTDYSLFKEDIEPKWEDDLNRHGGRWIFVLKRQPPAHQALLDQLWLEFVLALIGEQDCFGTLGRLINGAVVSVRAKVFRIALWIGDASAEDAILKIGHYMKSILSVGGPHQLSFEVHADAQKKKVSTAPKNLYVI